LKVRIHAGEKTTFQKGA